MASLIAATAALLGVGLGALLTEWREQRRVKQARREQVRVASRLVATELEALYTQAVAAPRALTSNSARDWDTQREVLARAMDDGGWLLVSSAYALLALVAAGEPLSEDSRAEIRRAIQRVRSLQRWSEDVAQDIEVLEAHQRHLEEVLEEKRRLIAERRAELAARRATDDV